MWLPRWNSSRQADDVSATMTVEQGAMLMAQAMGTVMATPAFMMAANRSPHWSTVRNHHIKEHGVCEGCGGVKLLQVHHIAPFHLHPELELEPANLITLCENPTWFCHFHLGHCADWHAFNPHVVNDARRQLLHIKCREYSKGPM